MALIGNVYVQSSDPGAVGYGYEWRNSTTGDVYARNTTNTGWVFLYNSNLTNGGLVPKSGNTTMTGALSGVTGFADAASHNFTTALQLNGVGVATQNYVDTAISSALSSIDSRVTSAIETYGSSISVGDKISFNFGTLDFSHEPTVNQPIPRPYFSGGVQATPEECYWIVSRVGDEGIPTGLSGGGQDFRFIFSDAGSLTYLNPQTVLSFCAFSYRTDEPQYKNGLKVAYLIVAKRA